MGAKNPDLWSQGDWREHFETAEMMHKARWTVRSVCEVCEVQLRHTAGGSDPAPWPRI